MNNTLPSTPSPSPCRPHDARSWWAAVRCDPVAFRRWLRAQYRGESTAAGRIELLRDCFAPDIHGRPHRVLTVIAAQERRHAGWVADLLRARGVALAPVTTPERYWPEVDGAITDLATGCAVGAHAERMRLEVIASDPGAPTDVRLVFQRILRDERFHERAFRKLAGPAALAATQSNHARGRRALGLVAQATSLPRQAGPCHRQASPRSSTGSTDCSPRSSTGSTDCRPG